MRHRRTLTLRGGGTETMKPYQFFSAGSTFIDKYLVSGKHHDVRVAGEDLVRFIAWVDCNGVFRGDEEVRAMPDFPPTKRTRGLIPYLHRSAPVIDRLRIPQDVRPEAVR
jgi:hypothetical protein